MKNLLTVAGMLMIILILVACTGKQDKVPVKYQSGIKFEKEVLAPKITEISDLLSKIPKSVELGYDPKMLNSQVTILLSGVNAGFETDGSWQSQMYRNILNLVSDLQISYQENSKLREIVRDSVKQQACENELLKALQENKDLRKELDRSKLSADEKEKIKTFQSELSKTKETLEIYKLENLTLRKQLNEIKQNR